MLRSFAPAGTYYVSSSAGSDANSGTSSSAAWQTIAHVNAQAFEPGDSILFKRGDVWNESLIPPSSGTSGNPITFDAYGTGPAPNLTGYYAVASSAWVLVSGNAWKAPLPSTYSTVNFCLFGSIWGQKVSAVSTNLTAQWDFYFSSGYVYVYSVGNPASFYNEPIVPMALSNTPVININSQSWLSFQHFLINWFDQYGVYVQGTSDHLVFANMESDSMIPQGTQPLGFYVDETAPGPGDIKVYNSEAHLNYDGFRFDGAATAITMINDKGYANRDGALVDNTGAVTYSYCHFYASSLAVAGSTDVEWTSGSGPTAGAGNIPQDTAPAVEVYQRYPAMVTLTVDDSGMTSGADTYYSGTVLPVADAAGIPVGAAITVGYPLAQTLVSEFQSWINAGRDVTSHSISHTYYTNTDALDLQYTGSGTAASLSISDKTLTITVTGASADSVTYNLAQGQPQGTMLALAQALAATGKYTYSFATPCQGPYGTGCAAYTAAALLSQDLADVSGQDVKTSVYHAQLNVAQLTSDEITLSRQWMTTNLTGLPSTPVYVYPGGYETTTMQGTAEGVPYAGARGALKEDLGVKDTYADGFNVQNITSFGVNPSWMGLEPSVLNQKIQALVWKESLWGVPWGIFWHLNELTQDDPVGGTEITNLINDFKSAGATVKTNTALVNWLLTGTQETGTDGNYYYKIPATSMTLDFRPTENSPVVDAGANLGTAYELDINGVNQNSYGVGWEIGAHVYQGYATYGAGSGSGDFTIGLGLDLPFMPELPQVWVNNNECKPAITSPNYTVAFPSTGTGGSWTCAADSTANGPYTAGSSSSLQTAVNDIEACRTAGSGTSSFLLTIPPTTFAFTTAYGLILPQSSSSPASACIAVVSSNDANLPDGQVVGAHGIQDNIVESSDIGLNNPDLQGDNLYYQSGPSTAVTPATQSVSASNQTSSSICPGSSACLTNFTIATGSFPTGFTVGTIITAQGFGTGTCNTSTNPDPCYDSLWVITSGGAGTGSLNAVPWGCYASGTTCTTELTWTGGSGNLGKLVMDGNITGIYTLTVNATTLLPIGTPSGITTAILPLNQNVVVPLTYGYVAPCTGPYTALSTCTGAGPVTLTVDSGTNQETVTAQQCLNQKGVCATFTKSHAVGTSLTFCMGGCTYTLANGNVITVPSGYNDAQYMYKITNSNAGNPNSIKGCNPAGEPGNPAPACAGSAIGPDHWLIEDGIFSPVVGSAGGASPVSIGDATDVTANTQMAANIHFAKDAAMGDWNNVYTGANSIADGFYMGCYDCSITDSQMSQMLRPGAEGHTISYGYGFWQKIVHNWSEGAAINTICGGFAGQVWTSTYYPLPCVDMEWRRNRFTYPFSWLGLSSYGNNVNPNWTQTYSFVRKDAFETKTADRYVVSGNIAENEDIAGGNYALTVRRIVNDSGEPGVNYANLNQNDYDVGNIYRNGCNSMIVQGRSNAVGSGGGAASGLSNLFFQNNLWYNVSYDDNPGCAGALTRGIAPGSGEVQWTGNITVSSGAAEFMATSCAPVDGTDCPGAIGANGGVSASSAYASGTITATFVPAAGTFANLPIVGKEITAGGFSVAGYNTSWMVTSAAASSITATAGGSAALGAASGGTLFPAGWGETAINVGDTVQICGCTGNAGLNTTGANSCSWTSTGYPGVGTPAISPSLPSSAPPAVYFATSQTSGDSSGSCTLSYTQGYPNDLIFSHITEIAGDNFSFGTSDDPSAGPSHQNNELLRDSILVGAGGLGSSSFSIPNNIESFMWNTATISNDHTVWPGQTASNYTEYCNNPNFLQYSECQASGMAGNSASYMWFPSNSCLGWVGSCSGNVPLTYPDYHSFALSCSGGSPSPYCAGQSQQASDGASMGANISVIDADQTLNTFVCPWACGSPGPYPDH